MNTKLYAYFLVLLQFILIISLLVINKSVFSEAFSMLVFLLGLGFGLYTLLFNKISNFNISPLIKKEAILITWGAYKYIRHPMYFCVLLMMLSVISLDLNLLNIFLYLFLIFVLFLKAKKEENLWKKESKNYEEYMNKTKMFIPFTL